uniref:Uncharacterized protein n=1 Tax=Oryza barthii TaxID=65489 RepID=A0A0D3GHJ6_9ORYZ
MDYLRCGGSHVLIGIRGPREDTVEVKDDGVLQEHFWSLEVVATFTNAVLWAGTHNPQMTNFSRPYNRKKIVGSVVMKLVALAQLIMVTMKRVMDLNGLESGHMQQKNMNREGQKREGEFTLREMTGGLCKTCLSGDIEVLSGTIYIIYPICKEPTDINPSGFAVMTNPGVHFVLKISQYILLSFLEVTVSYGQLAFSSGFFSLVYWDHDGDDILQGNHITVGQRRKKETGRKVRGIDIDQEEDSLFLLCCLM